jgi:glycosyltransferase involved in cell wall biosynthesis
MIFNGEKERCLDTGAFEFERDLTIVIPAFQCAPFLPAAIESALHSRPAQVLITTDGCGLEVPRIAERYERAHPGRVRVLYHRRRRGVARNVNQAVEHVRTPFFAKLDGDDVLLPGHLEAAFPVIADRPSLALVAGHAKRIEAGDHLAFDAGSSGSYTPDPAPMVMSGTAAFRFIVTWTPSPCSSGCIYRTSAFRQVGGFDPGIPWGEDWEIWLRFAKHWEVAYCNAASALYRIHTQSTTSVQTGANRLCFGYDAVFRRAAALCQDAEVTPLLRRAFLRVAGLYAKAALRQSVRLRPNALICGVRAIRALSGAIVLPSETPPAPLMIGERDTHATVAAGGGSRGSRI